MPFIGTQPDVGGYSVLDALTASATASYTLQLNSANFVPNSANQLLVSLNGVIQKPGSSFTVSGSTLTFSSALTSSDSIDFILAMGEPLLVGTPSDGTVSTAKIATDAVTGAKLANDIGISTTGNIATTGSGTLSVAGASTLTGALSAKGGAVFNEDGADVDFRVESDTKTHMFHVDGSIHRVGIDTGATDLAAGNYATLNVGGVVSNAGQQALFCTASKTSFASASYRLWMNGLGVGDSTTQAEGVGGVITLVGRTTNGDDNQVHAATIEAYKVNGTSGNYGFYMIGRTREHGNATMQTAYQYAYDRVQFFTNNTHRFNIDATGNLTASDTSIGSLSDERLKTNIKDHTYSLDTFKKFDVKTFDWKNPEEHGNRSNQTGLIAQEVEKVDPSLVYEYEVVEGAKDREHLTTTQISKKIVDDFTKEESTEIRDVSLAKASKLNQKDGMYISVIQQLITKIETLESEVAKLKG